MTTYDPIYLSETEHSLLDHSDVPGVPQGGATVLAVKRCYMGIVGNTTVPTGTYTYLPVGGFYQGDSGIFDLTDPTTWVAVESGIYMVTPGIYKNGGGLPGEWFLLGLEMDYDTFDTGPSGVFPLFSPDGISPQASVTGTFYVPAGSSIKAFLKHAHGSDLALSFTVMVTFIPAMAP